MSIDLREELSAIFAQACKVMKEKLDDSANVTAADLNAIRGFLKDNNITALPVAGSPLKELADKVEEFDKFPFAVSGSILPADDPAVTSNAAKAADA